MQYSLYVYDKQCLEPFHFIVARFRLTDKTLSPPHLPLLPLPLYLYPTLVEKYRLEGNSRNTESFKRESVTGGVTEKKLVSLKKNMRMVGGGSE